MNFLQQLSITILEHYIGKVIGDDAIDVIQNKFLPSEKSKTIQLAVDSASQKILQDPDRELVDILRSCPVNDLDTMENAIDLLYNTIDAQFFQDIFSQKIKEVVPSSISKERITSFSARYASILLTEFIKYSDESFLDKKAALALEDIKSLLEEINRKISLGSSPLDFPLDKENRITYLFDCLSTLSDAEFRMLIVSVLNRKEQSFLPRPIDNIGRVDFLSFMQQRAELNKVEKYLQARGHCK